MENLIAKTKSSSKRHVKTQSQDSKLPHKIKVVRYLVAQPEFHVVHVISWSGAGTIPYQNSQDGSFLGLRTILATTLWHCTLL